MWDMIFKKLMLLALLGCVSCGRSPDYSPQFAADTGDASSPQTIQRVIHAAQENLFKAQIEKKYWDMPSYLGIHYTAQYYLYLEWTGSKERSTLDIQRLRRELIGSQLKNGAFTTVRDHKQFTGDLNATLVIYAALKAMGEPQNGAILSDARKWILDHGGIEAANTLNKAFFAAFNQMKWEEIPAIPYNLFTENLILHPNRIFAQWIGPHVYPMVYLREQRVSRELGTKFNLDELRTTAASKPQAPFSRSKNPSEPVKVHIERIIKEQKPRGSFGGYTLATMLTLMVIDDFQKTWPQVDKRPLSATRSKAEKFVEDLIVNNASRNYRGVVDDGHLWDTALVADALLESGANPERLASAARYLAFRQVPNGGLPFGNDFETYPDTDDTSFAVTVWARFPELKENVKNGVGFLLSMQNNDGGMGAFTRNNNPIPAITSFVQKLADSADLYDESSPDIIGHVMEGLGRSMGQQVSHEKFFKKAVDYLEKTQNQELKAWNARWGVNYLYGTSAVVNGLIAMGYPTQGRLVTDGLAFISKCQNEDGGFGETTKSDLDRKLAGKGLSTPSQTAWALLALLVDPPKHSSQIKAGVDYLVKEFDKHGRWEDIQAVGTGHPGIVYMEYPSYPYVFPLKALSRYMKTQ